MGNRLHLAFKRQVPTEQARAYAERLGVTFFEVSSLCNFNITESFTELARTVLLRHGMDRLWRPSKGRHPAAAGGLQDSFRLWRLFSGSQHVDLDRNHHHSPRGISEPCAC